MGNKSVNFSLQMKQKNPTERGGQKKRKKKGKTVKDWAFISNIRINEVFKSISNLNLIFQIDTTILVKLYAGEKNFYY